MTASSGKKIFRSRSFPAGRTDAAPLHGTRSARTVRKLRTRYRTARAKERAAVREENRRGARSSGVNARPGVRSGSEPAGNVRSRRPSRRVSRATGEKMENADRAVFTLTSIGGTSTIPATDTYAAERRPNRRRCTRGTGASIFANDETGVEYSASDMTPRRAADGKDTRFARARKAPSARMERQSSRDGRIKAQSPEKGAPRAAERSAGARPFVFLSRRTSSGGGKLAN